MPLEVLVQMWPRPSLSALVTLSLSRPSATPMPEKRHGSLPMLSARPPEVLTHTCPCESGVAALTESPGRLVGSPSRWASVRKPRLAPLSGAMLMPREVLYHHSSPTFKICRTVLLARLVGSSGSCRTWSSTPVVMS